MFERYDIKKTKIKNAYIWICRVRTSLDTHETTKHLCKNRYIERSKLRLTKILQIIFFWAKEFL